jgi:hypothetical protein
MFLELIHGLFITWNPPSCDRIRPPRSQVACKLTSPAPNLSPNPPPSKFREPQFTQRLTKTTSGRIRHLLSGTVTDGGEEVCVDPGEMGAILEAGEARGPAKQGKEWTVGIGQWRRVDVAKCLRAQEMGSPQHQATFMHRVCIIVCCVSVYCIYNHNRNRVLLYSLFQENKSFGSKKPFAFILCCTRSCVEHNNISFS